MNNPFDFNNNSFIFPTSDNTGLDMNGNMHLRVGDNISIDTITGETHINSGWKAEEDNHGRFSGLFDLFK